MTLFLERTNRGVMSSTLQENLSGVRWSRRFAAQQFEMNKFDEASSTYRDNILKITRLMADYWSKSDFLCMLQVVIVVLSGTFLTATGRISLGVMVAFVTYSGMLIWPIRGLGQMMGFMGQAFVALTRVQEILDHVQEDYSSGENGLPIQGAIAFKDVRFGYTAASGSRQVTFEVPAGSTTAILGATGSGKSCWSICCSGCTITRRLGPIRRTELSSISRDWIRSPCRIVLQSVPVLATIRENIRVWPSGRDDPEIEAAARSPVSTR